MKVQLRNKVDPSLTVVEQLFVNRGIELKEVETYLGDLTDFIQHYEDLDNIEKAVEVILHHIDKGHNLLIQVDSDVDGYTSAALLYNFLESNFPDVKLHFQTHNRKAHGLEMTEEVLEGKYPLIIVPDAGSNEYEKHKTLYDKGISVIVLDHHEAPHSSEHAIVVNNQLSENYINKELSGVGVVWQVCRAIEDELVEVKKSHKEFLDLVALGLVADMMDLRSYETRALVNLGLDIMNADLPENRKSVDKGNYFINELIDKQSYSLGHEVTPMGIAFYIAPLINAVVRVGTPEERDDVFKCFIDSKAFDELPSTKRGAKEGDIEIRVEQGARIMTNIRNRQKREEQKGAESFGGHIDEEYLKNNSLVILDTEGAVISDLNGLIANQMQAKHGRPSLVVCERDGYIMGSGRGHETDVLRDFRQFIRDSGYAEFAEGHPNAFGVKFTEENFEKFQDYANKELNYENASKEIFVDYEFDNDSFDPTVILESADLGRYWGEGVDEPLFFIKDLEVNDTMVEWLGNSTLKITINGIPFLKFRVSDEVREQITTNSYMATVMDITFRPNLNYYMGKTTPQAFISDMKIKDQIVQF